MGHHEDERVTKAGYDRWAASYDDKDPSTLLDEPFLSEHLKSYGYVDFGKGKNNGQAAKSVRHVRQRRQRAGV